MNSNSGLNALNKRSTLNYMDHDITIFIKIMTAISLKETMHTLDDSAFKTKINDKKDGCFRICCSTI